MEHDILCHAIIAMLQVVSGREDKIFIDEDKILLVERYRPSNRPRCSVLLASDSV